MKIKKIVKISLLLIILLAVVYNILIMYKLIKINFWQNKIGENLPDIFKVELPVIRNQANYFCIRSTINDKYEADFIIDTKATPLAKMETINDYNANYWGDFPVFVSNLYGQKEQYPLYFFNSFRIQSLSFNKPLFKGISKSNAMYDLMDNDVIGKGIIDKLFWKFSLDDEKIILFSNKDSLLLYKETENYVKIENGLNDNISLFFSDIATRGDFMFDLGYGGEIMVNKNIFTCLSNKFSPKKYLTSRRTALNNDSSYVFDGINIEWNGIKIPNCQIVYRPVTNRNVIGVAVANRFNFVMAYNEKKNERIENNLYLQPRNNFQHFESIPYCSKFGFYIGKLKNEFIVKRIEIGGLADKAGINVNDKIINIDQGDFDLNDVENRLNFYLSDKQSVNLTIEKNGKTIDVVLNSALTY
jgi:hypothetical protein